jgi:adsorption protein B
VLPAGVHPDFIWGAAGWLAGALFILIAFYILLSALDDFVIDLLWIVRSVRRQSTGGQEPVFSEGMPERAAAILLPCWHESEVIGDMLDHNLAALRYSRYHFLVGAYANDPETIAAIRRSSQRDGRVRCVVVPHDGPTSKADCLNWICLALDDLEQETGEECAFVVQHDAEDLIHPDELALFNQRIDGCEFLQLPVLPLQTPLNDWTHGVYCDDFAESQLKDLATRERAGAFVPGCGVGTALRRDALRRIADGNGVIFDPSALTEDYDLGLRAYRLGMRQHFLPLEFDSNGPVATREYFPRRWMQAVRQRSRWIAGIALQGWEHHGWSGNWTQRWFLWRDRKGLWGNPVSLLCNLLLIAGAVALFVDRFLGVPWMVSRIVARHSWLGILFSVNFALTLQRLSVRAYASARVYGWQFALLSPLRFLWSNVLNAGATLRALHSYLAAKRAGRRLAWTKTSHAYPPRGRLLALKRTLPEVLESLGVGSVRSFEEVLLRAPAGVPEADLLMASGLVSEEVLMAALCRQHSLPRIRLYATEINPRLRHSIPHEVGENWRVIPFRAERGALHVACAMVPDDEMILALSQYTRMSLRFYLITAREFEELSPSSSRHDA